MPLIVNYKTLSSFLQMRNFLWILTSILFCGGLSAQRFARKIGSQGQPSGVYHIEPLSKSEIVLNLSYVFSGVGLNSLSSLKALYYPQKDSLGTLMKWVLYSNALTYRYQQYLRLDSTQ
jgi:hypothetical protein